jgi:hypothetical protein
MSRETVAERFEQRITAHLAETAARLASPETSAAVPTVTGRPGSPPVVFEDARAPHQIVLGVLSGAITVSCNCLAPRKGGFAGKGCPREFIASRQGTFPAAGAVAAYRSWHAGRGAAV